MHEAGADAYVPAGQDAPVKAQDVAPATLYAPDGHSRHVVPAPVPHPRDTLEFFETITQGSPKPAFSRGGSEQLVFPMHTLFT